jgi:hypothetical protein
VPLDRIERHGEQAAVPVTPRTVRRFEAEGLQWRVYETPAPALDRRGGRHLVFDAEMVMRRVRNFPPDWHELPDDALYALSLEIRR